MSFTGSRQVTREVFMPLLLRPIAQKRKPRANEGEGPGACLRTGDARKSRDANGEFAARAALVRYPNRQFRKHGHESNAMQGTAPANAGTCAGLLPALLMSCKA